MASKAQRDANKAARKVSGFGSGVTELEEKRKAKLDEPEVQREIRRGDPVPLRINGEDFRIHPLAAEYAMEFGGLLSQIQSDFVAAQSKAGETGKEEADKVLRVNRMSGIMLERYYKRFLPFLALATRKAGELDEDEAATVAADFRQRFRDRNAVGLAFIIMFSQNTYIEDDAKN